MTSTQTSGGYTNLLKDQSVVLVQGPPVVGFKYILGSNRERLYTERCDIEVGDNRLDSMKVRKACPVARNSTAPTDATSAAAVHGFTYQLKGVLRECKRRPVLSPEATTKIPHSKIREKMGHPESKTLFQEGDIVCVIHGYNEKYTLGHAGTPKVPIYGGMRLQITGGATSRGDGVGQQQVARDPSNLAYYTFCVVKNFENVPYQWESHSSVSRDQLEALYE